MPALVRHKHTGICPTARGVVVAEIMNRHPGGVWLVVCPQGRGAEQVAEDLEAFCLPPPGTKGAPEIRQLPATQNESDDLKTVFAASADRMAALSRLRARRSAGAKAGPALVIVSTPEALAMPVPAMEALKAHELTLTAGATHPFAQLLAELTRLDYDCEALCESPGHYAVRGGIIDVYPITAEKPYRLDFFGDELEVIKELDPVTQRSGAQVTSITLSASPRLKLSPSTTGLADYLPQGCRVILVDPAALDEAMSRLARDATTRRSATFGAIVEKADLLVGVADIDEPAYWFDHADTREVTWDTESLGHLRRYPTNGLIAQDRLAFEEEARLEFLQRLRDWRAGNYQIVLLATKESEEQRLQEVITEAGLWADIRPEFQRGALNEGFRLTFRADSPELSARLKRPGLKPGHRGLVVVTETEIFGRQRTRRPAPSRRALVPRSQVDHLLDFAELVEGDFVVHLQHGIALFRGLTRLETRDGTREVISLEFDDHVTLHVPLQESHLISRYVGLSKSRPQLGRIGTNRWEKTRKAAEKATIDLAADLLRIHAEREAQKGFACESDTTWQREFEAAFPYTETPDQLKAINETKADMERPRPMDRLICGDVGFGKTEVAIRAAFKAVQSGRQVAVLVPTTVLAQQHLNAFRERMAGYPIAVEMVSRFRTKPEQTKILAATSIGQIDILVGTHRLLQKDVTFKNLGLAIIDEEQRFGVKHKERFKAMRSSIDVLSMSATPIPRTLYMAMTGAREMSVIETAPVNRLPIQTLVRTYDEQLVVKAIRQEAARGGQVFYLHNRVQTIDFVANRLRELMPELTIGTGHGQMDESRLEQVMTDFVAGTYDVLVCTTIIESGLDIPNCNTIIIEGADRFGLSQLYQLRGRVGRFKHQAYAYLLLHRHTRLMELARERLTAMRSHNQLGAGFRIAMRDLELRGAGNLLGAQQSGHIVGVGFELYCQLLRQSVARLKGEKTASHIRANVKLDFVFVGEGNPDSSRHTAANRHADGYTAIKEAEAASQVTERILARLPANYIAEARLRIDFYRRLAMAENREALKQLSRDLKDRFGDYEEPVKALLLITEIRILAEQKGITSVLTQGSRLKCTRNSGRPDDFVMVGARFPRLTAPEPLLRLREIITFLTNQPTP